PAEKTGLAAMTGSVIRTGGTTKYPGDDIDGLLESLGARVETSIGLESGSASMSVLKENVDTGLSIMADLLMNPAFPQNKIDLQKVQMHSGISRRNDDPGDIASREFLRLIYGSSSVYGRLAEHATVDAVTRDDMVAFHKRYFCPNNVMLGVWGDFNTKDMLKKIDATFKSWKKGEFKRPQPPPVDYKFDSSVNFVRKDDVNQSSVYIGHIGGLRNNPDYFALGVMNDVLSGGFGSRLFSRVRSQQGLAYSVFGVYSANYDYPGMFYAGAETKSESTVKSIRAILHELELIRKEEITDDELARAKDSYLNSYVFNFEDPGQVLLRLMTYEYYGYPKDFLQKEKENVEKVTKADVLRVAQKYVHPDQVRILVLGRDKDFDEPLSTLGKVNEIDVTIPPPAKQ
ncbi:MAG TPA: pitrilysin family protein, partial [Acidobacteriota bacterium]|nr:pitrilysin family protein [Acidobacteriota bacterium]